MRLGPLACFLLIGGPVVAQKPVIRFSGQAIAAGFLVDPTPNRERETSFRVTQPIVSGTVDWRIFRARATLDFEGLTLKEGEPAPGDWGEGFVDRRHPHTYVHELMISARRDSRCLGLSNGCRLGAAIGKGFVPFGSEDPMSRPFLRFPVNHHLSQILERAVALATVGIGPIAVDGSTFNGDEPERPGEWPRLARFGDSWSLRATLTPVAPLELSGSVASVASPEHRPGAGATQHKVHLGARYDHATHHAREYALLEWARTSELDGFFVFKSVLAEGSLTRGPLGLEYRFERTDRPEEERLSPFRSQRPHLENSILGITRWTVHAAGADFRLLSRSGWVARALFEVSRGRIDVVRQGAFDLIGTYGKDHFWAATLGLKLSWREERGHRMGSY